MDRQEASEALATAERAERRARLFQGYEGASLPLIAWGVAWMVGNGLTELWPERMGLNWLLADAIGIAGTLAPFRRRPGLGAEARRLVIGLGGMAAFAVCALLVLPPTSVEQVTAFLSLIAAFFLIILGVWTTGPRLVVLGFVLTAAITAGHLLLPDHRLVWFGAAGGGALVLAGVWMRKV